MPVIKSAQKKLRQDRKKEKANNILRNLLDSTLKKALKNPTLEDISKATKVIDKLAKKHIIHANKAARMKSKLSKLVKGKVVKKSGKQRTKKT